MKASGLFLFPLCFHPVFASLVAFLGETVIAAAEATLWLWATTAAPKLPSSRYCSGQIHHTTVAVLTVYFDVNAFGRRQNSSVREEPRLHSDKNKTGLTASISYDTTVPAKIKYLQGHWGSLSAA